MMKSYRMICHWIARPSAVWSDHFLQPGRTVINEQARKILNAFAEFVFLAILTLLPVLTVYVDIKVIGHGLIDNSITEFTQETLIFLSAALFSYCAWKSPQSRGLLLLVAGFFICMLIREHDELLNRISHGFWFYPAMLVAVVSIGGAIACRGTILAPLAAFVETKPYLNIFFGLLVVLVFSRIFGSSNLLWISIMGDDYKWVYRSAIQEGLELFGYIFIFYGSYLFFRRLRIDQMSKSEHGLARQPVHDRT